MPMEDELPGNIISSLEDQDRDYFLHDFYAQDTSINTVIDLDEYFNYNRAGENENEKLFADKPLLFEHYLIFINNIDSFNGKYIAQLLPKLEEKYRLEKSENVEEIERRSSDEVDESPQRDSGIIKEEVEADNNDSNENNDKDRVKESDLNEPYSLGDLQNLEDPFNEYEYMDALYALYDVGKLTTLEYAELLQFETDPERLAYLESKFSKLKKTDTVDKETNTGISSVIDKIKQGSASEIITEMKFIATLKDPSKEAATLTLPYVQEIVMKNESDKKRFKESITKCGIFVIDISDCKEEVNEARSVLNVIINRLQEIKDWTPKRFDEMENAVTFILISSLMTWSRTPPLDPEEPDEPLDEKMYNKRRYHPNYLDHYNFEREVLAAMKRMQGKFNAVLISTGIIYGYEQNTLHYLFKSAWLNGDTLPVFGKGRNRIPLIHIDDLAKIIHYLMHHIHTSKFVFALENVSPTLKEITKAVSSSLGSGKIKRVGEETAFLIPEISQEFYDKLMANFNVQSAIVGEDKKIEIQFQYPSGFIESIKKETETFKMSRNLKAIKLVVLGPPGCGRTKVCKALSKFYKITYLDAKSAVDMYIQKLQGTIDEIQAMRLERAKKSEEEGEVEGGDDAEENEDEAEEEEEEEEDELDEEEEEERLENAKKKLAKINDKLILNNGKLGDEQLARVVKDVLLSVPCQNQGYVLDGFPVTLKQAQIVFGVGAASKNDDEDEADEEEEKEEEQEEEGEEEEDDQNRELEGDYDFKPQKMMNKKTAPNEVFVLEANDDFLYQALLTRDESTETSEKEILQQISKYRELNSDNGILLFFDELEIYPNIFKIENDITPNMCIVTRKLMPVIGKSANYESESIEQLLKASKEEQSKRKDKLRLEKEQQFKKNKDDIIGERLRRYAAGVDRMKQQEEDILFKESLPARHYLMKFVLPSLTSGLIEVARVKPADPIDYLAEFLFEQYPAGRSFVLNRMTEKNEAQKLVETLYDLKRFLDTQAGKKM